MTVGEQTKILLFFHFVDLQRFLPFLIIQLHFVECSWIIRINNAQNEYKYHAVFVLQRASAKFARTDITTEFGVLDNKSLIRHFVV